MIWDDFGLHFLLSKPDRFSCGWECNHSLVLVEEQDSKDCQVVRKSEHDGEFGAAHISCICIYIYTAIYGHLCTRREFMYIYIYIVIILLHRLHLYSPCIHWKETGDRY